MYWELYIYIYISNKRRLIISFSHYQIKDHASAQIQQAYFWAVFQIDRAVLPRKLLQEVY